MQFIQGGIYTAVSSGWRFLSTIRSHAAHSAHILDGKRSDITHTECWIGTPVLGSLGALYVLDCVTAEWQLSGVMSWHPKPAMLPAFLGGRRASLSSLLGAALTRRFM